MTSVVHNSLGVLAVVEHRRAFGADGIVLTVEQQDGLAYIPQILVVLVCAIGECHLAVVDLFYLAYGAIQIRHVGVANNKVALMF